MVRLFIVIMIKVGGNFQLSILIQKIEADDVSQALILKKMFCFSVGKVCSRKVPPQLVN